MRKCITHLALAVAFVAAAAAQARAEVVAYVGTTVGAPTWTRPVANGNLPPVPPPSGVGTAVPYSVQPFLVTEAASYSIQSASTIPAGWDNYTFLYANFFSVGDPFNGVVIGNDDNPTVGLSGFTVNLTPGNVYYLVTTGFSNTDFGAFTNTITGGSAGPGVIILGIPEPGPLALAGVAGALGLAVRGLRRRKSA